MLAVQNLAGTNGQVNIQIWLEMKQDLDLCLEIERDRGKKPLNNVPRLAVVWAQSVEMKIKLAGLASGFI
jgi:hypothetical protein